MSAAVRRAPPAFASVAAAVLLLGATAAPCTPPAEFAPRAALSADGISLVFRTVPAAIVVGRHFSIEAIVCAAGSPPALTRVDADMPEHRHGMNYRPTVAAQGAGRWVAEGFLFHMPGRWRLTFDVDHGGRRTRLVSEVAVE